MVGRKRKSRRKSSSKRRKSYSRSSRSKRSGRSRSSSISGGILGFLGLKKSKRGRKKSPSVFVRFFRSVFAVVFLTGSLVGLYLFLDAAEGGFDAGLPVPMELPVGLLVGEEGGAHLGALQSHILDRLPDDYTQALSGDATSAGNDTHGILSLGTVGTAVGVFADVEEDWDSLSTALDRMEDLGLETAFFLGDLTKFGDVGALQKGREVFDSSSVEVIVLPGDHDLAASVAGGDTSGRASFREVFGPPNKVLEKYGYTFLLFDNSPNFTKMSEDDMKWFQENVDSADFVLLSQPLYHPTNTRVMGIFEGEKVSTVRQQALELLDAIRKSNVRAVIAADQHAFSTHKDPEDEELRHIVTGALVSNEAGLRNTQAPRFMVLGLREGDESAGNAEDDGAGMGTETFEFWVDEVVL